MASIRKRNGRYQAQVRIGSVSKSASFSSKAEARAWAAGEEAALYSSCKASGSYTPTNMAEVLSRYMDVISPEKAGYRDELTVIRAMLREDWTTIPIDGCLMEHSQTNSPILGVLCCRHQNLVKLLYITILARLSVLVSLGERLKIIQNIRMERIYFCFGPG